MGPVLWNCFVSDLSPDTATIKYADDTTIYHPIARNNIIITNSNAKQATVTWEGNPIQTAVTYMYAADWSNANQMILNSAKSQVITFTLRKQLCMDSICIEDQPLTEFRAVKLLGVAFDANLKFHDQVERILSNSRPAFHALVQLKKSGINNPGLSLFFKARILPILCYAAPCWYPHITNGDKLKLERYQRLCLRIIAPFANRHEDRLTQLNICDINITLANMCRNYVARLQRSPKHPLHSYSQKTLSARTGRVILPPHRTSLYSNLLFYKF
jgi:hypothetical protein